MPESELKTKITTDITGLREGTEAASSQFRKIGDQIKGSFSQLNSHVSNQMKQLSSGFTSAIGGMMSLGTIFGSAIAGILSYGAMKGAIDSTLAWGRGVHDLQEAMGMASPAATNLAVALRMIGVSTETYISANMRLGMRLKANEDALVQIGVKTRDVNGALLSQKEIFDSAISAMMSYKEGADRNQFALYAFGRNAQQVYDFMKLNNEVMARAAAIAEQFGLSLDIEKLKMYGREINVMNLFFEAVKIKVGAELIPELVRLGGWFGEVGPTVISVTVTAVKILIGIFDTLITGVRQTAIFIQTSFLQTADILAGVATSIYFGLGGAFNFINNAANELWIAVSAAFTQIGGIVGSVAAAVYFLAQGEFKLAWDAIVDGVTDAGRIGGQALIDLEKNAAKTGSQLKADFGAAWGGLKDGFKDAEKAGIDGFARIGKLGDEWAKRMKGLFATTKGTLAAPVGGGEEKAKGTKEFVEPEMTSRVVRWKEALDQIKIDENAFFNFSIDREKSYWLEKLELVKGNTRRDQDDRKAIRAIIFDLEKKSVKDLLDIDIAKYRQMQEDEKTSGVERIKIEDMILKRLAEIYGKDSVEFQRGILEKMKMLDAYDKSEKELVGKAIEGDVKAYDASVEAKRAEINQKHELGLISAAEMVGLERDVVTERFFTEMDALNRLGMLWGEYPEKYAEVMERIKLLKEKYNADMRMSDIKLVDESKKTWDKYLQPISSAFSTMIHGIISGTTTLSKALSEMFQNILLSFIDMLIQMVVEWVRNQIVMVVTGKAIRAPAAVSEVISEAAVGAAAGFSSVMEAVPYPYNLVMAPVVAAETFASIMSFAPAASAEGGWDVDKTQMALIHKDEMVLPAGIAEGFRGMFAGGGGGGGGWKPNQKTFADLGSAYGKGQGKAFVNALRGAARNMGFKR